LQSPATTASSLPSSIESGGGGGVSRRDENGWGTIQVFYGSQSQLPALSDVKDKNLLKCREWYGQARQDELVATLLRNKTGGYFVDVAANDAIRLSSTFGLESNLNWGGLCVEANPRYWMGLSARRCEVVGAVVGNRRGERVPFRFGNNEFGGIVGDHFDNKRRRKDQPVVLEMVTLLEVLERMRAPKVVDFMSLDVEGAEDVVLQPEVLSQHQFRLITIERPKENLVQLLEANGYRMIKQVKSWGETMWSHPSFEHELDMSALGMDTESYVYQETC
jgi:FkbM family methyltransferase